MGRKGPDRRIVVEEVEYLWRAAPDDMDVKINIWPSDRVGPLIWARVSFGRVVRPGIIRQVIEHAIHVHGYNPKAHGKVLPLYQMDGYLTWDDAEMGETV
jgi:hypothetical protein